MTSGNKSFDCILSPSHIWPELGAIALIIMIWLRVFRASAAGERPATRLRDPPAAVRCRRLGPIVDVNDEINEVVRRRPNGSRAGPHLVVGTSFPPLTATSVMFSAAAASCRRRAASATMMLRSSGGRARARPMPAAIDFQPPPPSLFRVRRPFCGQFDIHERGRRDDGESTALSATNWPPRAHSPPRRFRARVRLCPARPGQLPASCQAN